MRRPVLLLLLLLLGACKAQEDATATWPGTELPARARADALDPSVPALPFPSSYFLVQDERTVTGFRVAFADDTLPRNRDGVQTMPDFWNERDGFSINSAMFTFLPGVVPEGVPTHADIDRYADDDVNVVVFRLDDGERLPIWVELDATAPDDAQRLLTIRPAIPMEWNTRYVVAIRRLKDASGKVVPASEAFAALRDGTPSDDPSVAARRTWYEDVLFPAVEAQGFARDELQIAWDFHTASRENTLGRMEWMREDAFAWLEEQGGFDYTITKNEERDCSVPGEHIFRHIEGEFTAPLYTLGDGPENPDDTELQAVLTRGEDGMPFRNGTTRADFILRIPCSVAAEPAERSAPILQYGHGLLGSKSEANTDWLARFADERGFVIFAMDWTGFMEKDVVPISLMLASMEQEKLNASHFAIVPERSAQGMVEKMLGLRLVSTVLVNDDVLKIDGVPVVDGSRRYYYGNSQGAILGSALVAMSPDIERGVLGVGGGPYSLLLPRSADFDKFFLLLKNFFTDHREIMLFVIGLTQQLWDPAEPGGWVWDMTRDAEKPKQVLQQVAIYDNQVTTLGAHYLARAWGSFTPADAVRPIWGVEEVDVGEEGREGTALVEWRYTDLPDEPFEALPPGSKEVVPAEYADGRKLDPHECPRRELEGQEQAWVFLTTGKVISTCPEGGCVGTVAVCGD